MTVARQTGGKAATTWLWQIQLIFGGFFTWVFVGFFIWVFCWVGFSFYWFWFGFGMSFSSDLGWLWVGFFGAFSLIFVWLDLSWVAVVMVGWCWVGGWMFVIFFFFVGLLWPMGKRRRTWKVREKNNKLLIYTATVAILDIYKIMQPLMCVFFN